MASSVPDISRRLTEDVASMRRVRNRISATTDAHLPKVLGGLIPRLFRRLEDYSRDFQVVLSPAAEGSSVAPMSQRLIRNAKAQVEEDIFGILATGMERIKGNPQLEISHMVSDLLTFSNSDHNVVSAWSVTFLQVALQRSNGRLDWFPTLEGLLRVLANVHSKLSQLPVEHHADAPDPSTESLLIRYGRISWLVLDCVMLLSGHRPVVDWDMDEFDPTKLQSANLIDDKSTRQALAGTMEHAFSQGDNGTSLISLLFDLILFWPDGDHMSLSAVSLQRMTLRSKAFHNQHGDDDLGQQTRQLRGHFQGPFLANRIRRSRQAGAWSQSAKVYIRFLKLNALKLALWPVEQALFQSNQQFDDRAIFLAMLTANSDSMHGKVAMSFLQGWRASYESLCSGGKLATGPPVSLSLVCSIMITVVGETELRETLEAFQAENGEGCWQKILGPTKANRSMDQAPLPSLVTQMAAETLLSSTIQWTGSDAVDASYAALLIKLAVQQSQQGTQQKKSISIRLVAWVYRHKKCPPTSIPSILDGILEVLRMVIEVGEADREEMRTNQQGQLRGGVPMPFTQRPDLNRLLSSHRSSLKRKNVSSEDASTARKDAYTLIELLAPSVIEWEQEHDWPFALPRMLMMCMSFEDNNLKPLVSKALEALLRQYEGVCMDESVDFDVVSLLPALVETMYSDDESTRRSAMAWIQRLLVRRDLAASLYMCSRLIGDEDAVVAKMANTVLSVHSLHEDVSVGVATASALLSIKFLDSSGDGADFLRNDLDHRICMLQTELQLTDFDESTILLMHNSFSSEAASEAYFVDASSLRRACGLAGDEQDKTKVVGADDRVCSICYEDDIGNGEWFSLPCRHLFCCSCWTAYIEDASKSSPQSFLNLRCPDHKCCMRIMPNHLTQLAPHLLPTWNSYLLQAFIEAQPNSRFCPGSDCSCVAVLHQKDSNEGSERRRDITCDRCNTAFCFQCGGAPHKPASCEDVKQWTLLMARSDIAKKLHSKPCPGCHAFIEKSGGCNHMSCTKCGTDFCWLCLKLLDSHLQEHHCKPYDPAEDDFERHALSTVTRFRAHEDAKYFALKQSEAFSPEKLLEAFWFLDEGEAPDVLCRALATLAASRSFLMNSYIAMLGLLHDKPRHKQHGIHHACLETFTERLNQLTETNLQRLYQEHGQHGILSHFKKLDCYDAITTKYMERINNL